MSVPSQTSKLLKHIEIHSKNVIWTASSELLDDHKCSQTPIVSRGLWRRWWGRDPKSVPHGSQANACKNQTTYILQAYSQPRSAASNSKKPLSFLSSPEPSLENPKKTKESSELAEILGILRSSRDPKNPEESSEIRKRHKDPRESKKA